jgi:hypothetical protein
MPVAACPNLNSFTNNATHMVDASAGKLYVWRTSATSLTNAKSACIKTKPSIPGATLATGYVVTYNR